MKWKFKKNIVKKVLDGIMVFYNTDNGAFYGLDGALQHFLFEHDEFETNDVIDYLVQQYQLDYKTAEADAQELLMDIAENKIIEALC